MKTKDQSFWNFRVFAYKDGDGYGIHETLYDKDGKVDGWTQDAIVVGDTVKELIEVLEMIKQDIQRFPEVLDYE